MVGSLSTAGSLLCSERQLYLGRAVFAMRVLAYVSEWVNYILSFQFPAFPINKMEEKNILN